MPLQSVNNRSKEVTGPGPCPCARHVRPCVGHSPADPSAASALSERGLGGGGAAGHPLIHLPGAADSHTDSKGGGFCPDRQSCDVPALPCASGVVVPVMRKGVPGFQVRGAIHHRSHHSTSCITSTPQCTRMRSLGWAGFQVGGGGSIQPSGRALPPKSAQWTAPLKPHRDWPPGPGGDPDPNSAKRVKIGFLESVRQGGFGIGIICHIFGGKKSTIFITQKNIVSALRARIHNKESMVLSIEPFYRSPPLPPFDVPQLCELLYPKG